jgi:hypothetical protein
VSYEGVCFTYNASLASSVVAETVPEQKEGPDVPYWMAGPEHLKFEFKGFTRAGVDPAIFVFPVRSKYVDLDPNDTHATDTWLNGVNHLRDVLSKKTALPRPSWREGSSVGSAPFLPPINAAVIFIGQQRFMKFKSGQGVRYLAQIAQESRPIGTEPYETVYSFQGLTGDGKYYVAARFPAFLAAGPPPTPTLSPSTAPDWVDDYNQHLIQKIEQAKGSDFFQSLDQLDAIVGSLTVNSSAMTLSSGTSPVLPGMPPTGTQGNTGDNSAPGPAGIVLVLAFALVMAGLALRGRRPATG